MGDDGAGIEVVNQLKESDLPDNIDVIDGGTPGIGLIDMMSGYSRVIVVDAVIIEGDTSQCVVYMAALHSPHLSSARPVLREAGGERMGLNSDDKCSLHEMELTAVLKLMQTLGMKIPEITLIGIPAFNIAPGIGLSEGCKGLIPQAVELALNTLNRDSDYLSATVNYGATNK